VHPDAERTLREPRIDLCDHLAGVALVTGRAICAAQHDELMMPCGLPDHLRIAGHTRVAVVDARGELQRRRAAGFVVAVPVDGIAERVVLEAEKGEAVISDGVRSRDQPAAPGGHHRVGRRAPAANGLGAQGERRCTDLRQLFGGMRRQGHQAKSHAGPVDDVAYKPLDTPGELARRHPAESVRVPVQGLHRG
jgi:hypothetical protein